ARYTPQMPTSAVVQVGIARLKQHEVVGKVRENVLRDPVHALGNLIVFQIGQALLFLRKLLNELFKNAVIDSAEVHFRQVRLDARPKLEQVLTVMSERT